MFRIKIDNKFWNFTEGKLTDIKDENTLIKSSIEAKNIVEFLAEVLPTKSITLEMIDDNSI